MNLITFIFDVERENQEAVVRSLQRLRDFWEDKQITVSLFRDVNNLNRFLQIILTEKSVDEITRMIQEEAEVKTVFETMKTSQGRVTVSCYEQIL